jgi:hypothetical protein
VADCLRMLSVADVVTTASTYIATRARQHHEHVVCLPDSIDLRHFNVSKDEEDLRHRSLHAVWSGVAVKAFELEPLLPLLDARGIGLTVISDCPPPLAFPYVFRRWQYKTFSTATSA